MRLSASWRPIPACVPVQSALLRRRDGRSAVRSPVAWRGTGILAGMAEQTPEPFATGRLDVGDGRVLYHEQIGAPEGTPVVYLHGGPGAGCTPGARRSFDLRRHRAVLFDQRAAGRSTPHASDEGVRWVSIDMNHHIDD